MTKPAKNTICLWYDGDAEDAARFYAKTFPDSSVGAVHRAPGDFHRIRLSRSSQVTPREQTRRDVFVSQGRTKKPGCLALDISAFPCEVCWLLFGSNGGHSVHHTLRYDVIVTLADLHRVPALTAGR